MKDTYIQTNYTLDIIGYFGPLILAIENIYFLWERQIQLFSYFTMVIVNTLINKSLKGIFKEPRPLNGINILDTEIHYGTDIYGMPSGHAQSVAFSMMYLYMATKNIMLLILNSIILTLTALQRWNYKKHTFSQLLVGSISGILTSFILFHMVSYWIKYNIR
jgi:membrane-associated phospholipid phosphatase